MNRLEAVFGLAYGLVLVDSQFFSVLLIVLVRKMSSSN